MRTSFNLTLHTQLGSVEARQHQEAKWPHLDDLGGVQWVIPGWFWSAQTTRPITANRLYYQPIYVERSRSFIRIGVHVTTAVASSVLRLGIYAASFDSNGDLTPGALTVDAGTVDSSTTGEKEIVIAETLAEGFHWLASSSGHGPTLSVPSLPSAVAVPVTPGGTAINAAKEAAIYWVDVADGTAALPDPATAPTNRETSQSARVQLRAG